MGKLREQKCRLFPGGAAGRHAGTFDKPHPSRYNAARVSMTRAVDFETGLVLKRMASSPEPARTPDESAEPSAPGPAPASRLRRLASSTIIFAAMAACIVVAAVLVAVWGGIRAGQDARAARATQTTVAEIDAQFEKGLADLEAGNFELAAQRFALILELNPTYPGAAERLAEARRSMNGGAVVEATGIPTSEADTNEERLAEARELYDDGQWEAAIDRLEMLRAQAPDFHTAEVEDMLHESLKALGLRHIRTDERLEEGIILLDQAALIKPLDDVSEGERLIANLYVTGQSYWGLNWPIVIQNFSEIYAVAPNYRDVQTRLWDAYVTYADQLWLAGTPCDSVSLYQSAAYIRNTVDVADKIEGSNDACLNPTATPTMTLLPGEPTPPPAEGTPPAEGEEPPPQDGG